MAIERKTVFYELLLRGAYGGDHQVDDGGVKLPVGAFCGGHYIEADVVIDTDTGEVLQFKPRPAQPLTRDKIEDFLGARATAFIESHNAVQAERDAIKAERDALRRDLQRGQSVVN